MIESHPSSPRGRAPAALARLSASGLVLALVVAAGCDNGGPVDASGGAAAGGKTAVETKASGEKGKAAGIMLPKGKSAVPPQ